jgi:hypothetical protein
MLPLVAYAAAVTIVALLSKAADSIATAAMHRVVAREADVIGTHLTQVMPDRAAAGARAGATVCRPTFHRADATAASAVIEISIRAADVVWTLLTQVVPDRAAAGARAGATVCSPALHRADATAASAVVEIGIRAAREQRALAAQVVTRIANSPTNSAIASGSSPQRWLTSRGAVAAVIQIIESKAGIRWAKL